MSPKASGRARPIRPRGGVGPCKLAEHKIDGRLQVGVHMIVAGTFMAQGRAIDDVAHKIDQHDLGWCESRC